MKQFKRFCVSRFNGHIFQLYRHDDANQIVENLSMSVNSLVAEHVSANETNDTFMNIDEIEHSNNNSENVDIETPSNQQVNLHLNHADNFIVIFIFELFLF